MPSVTVIVPVSSALVTAVIDRVPGPFLVKSAIEPPKAAPSVMVTAVLPWNAFSTVMIALAPLNETTPFRVRFCWVAPKISVLLEFVTETALASVRAAPPATRRVLFPLICSVPNPTGLAVMVAPTVAGVLSAPKMSVPAWRSRLVLPVWPKLFTPLRTRAPVPALLILPVVVPVILPEMIRLTGEKPSVVMV